MTHYIGVGTQSGHDIVIHGDDALAEYERDAEQGDAEPFRLLRAVGADALPVEDHEHVAEHGNCYGDCDLIEY